MERDIEPSLDEELGNPPAPSSRDFQKRASTMGHANSTFHSHRVYRFTQRCCTHAPVRPHRRWKPSPIMGDKPRQPLRPRLGIFPAKRALLPDCGGPFGWQCHLRRPATWNFGIVLLTAHHPLRLCWYEIRFRCFNPIVRRLAHPCVVLLCRDYCTRKRLGVDYGHLPIVPRSLPLRHGTDLHLHKHWTRTLKRFEG